MYLIANFKQNLNKADYQDYIDIFIADYSKEKPRFKGINVVFCPPAPYLYLFNKFDNYENIHVGIQDISRYKGGSNTGEISALQASDFSKYVILGHSERRIKFSEGVDDVNTKLSNSLESGLKPVVCVRNIEDLTSLPTVTGVKIAYEPVENIGGTQALNPQGLTDFYKKTGLSTSIIYGGSVNSENIKDLASLSFVEGFLVGGASLNPASFINILKSLS